MRAAAALLLSASVAIATEGGFSTFSYAYDVGQAWEPSALTLGDTECRWCPTDWINDGECDRLCNQEACGWDGDDCYHNASSCYNDPYGVDYRGTQNMTASGLVCQYWSDQWPNTHTYTAVAYPDSGLGGHNFCRNPDPDDGSTGPWCHVSSLYEVWAYCDVGVPSTIACTAESTPMPTHELRDLSLGEWVYEYVYEHAYQYFKIEVPAALPGIEVVLYPETGDPDMYLSFDKPFPSGHEYQYVEDAIAVDLFKMKRDMWGFCGEAGQDAACSLYISVTAYETSNYRLAVFSTSGDSSCSPNCDWGFLGDGVCQEACNTTECEFDRGDCSRDGGFQCNADCKPDWVDDGYCDMECFTRACGWDGADCGRSEGCADECLDKFLGDGECHVACNVAACGWDKDDCFHDHSECFSEANGADYRGTVAHTISGHRCQAWSAQFPKVHTRTFKHYPNGGLGGHNYCRNPDGETGVWCFPVDSDLRWELCDIGAPAVQCVPLPPPVPPPLSPSLPRLSAPTLPPPSLPSTPTAPPTPPKPSPAGMATWQHSARKGMDPLWVVNSSIVIFLRGVALGLLLTMMFGVACYLHRYEKETLGQKLRTVSSSNGLPNHCRASASNFLLKIPKMIPGTATSDQTPLAKECAPSSEVPVFRV